MKKDFAIWLAVLLVVVLAAGAYFYIKQYPNTNSGATYLSQETTTAPSISTSSQQRSWQAPSINSVSPTTGGSGDTVTIYGSNFDANSLIVIGSGNSVDPKIINYNSASYAGTSITPTSYTNTSLKFVVPSNIYIDYYFPIYVTERGSALKSNLVHMCILGDPRGGVLDNCPPTLGSELKLSGAPGDQLQIFGTFTPSSNAVVISNNNGIVTKILSLNSPPEKYYNQLRITVPNIPAGIYNLTVQNANGVSNVIPLIIALPTH